MKYRPFLVSLVSIALCFPPSTQASTVLQVTFDELTTSSEFIFEGHVVEKRVESDARGLIHTFVTFEVLDIFKGKHSGRTIVLRYLGGTVGEVTMRIPDVVPPDTGEKGIYFVESLSQQFAHPLYGWDQGQFILKADKSQTERVFTAAVKAVVGFVNGALKANGMSNGVALGVSIATTDTRTAIGTDGFKKILELTSADEKTHRIHCIHSHLGRIRRAEYPSIRFYGHPLAHAGGSNVRCDRRTLG
jgi:hypothetical protein